jgi:hypothetical protein
LAPPILRHSIAIAIALVAAPAVAQPKPDDEGEIVAKPPAPAAPASSTPAPKAAPPASPAAAPAASASPAPATGEIDALRARIDALEHRPSPIAALTEPFTVTGYIQAQYEGHQDSDDQLRQGGGLYNQDRFLVRRARLRIDGDWQYAAMMLELQGNTTHGPAYGLHHAEASLQYRVDRTKKTAPWVMATLGLFDTPFGYELVESPRYRPFMERSIAGRSMFPGEPDLGFRMMGGFGFFRWTAAAVNGEPLEENAAWVGQDPNQAKDVIFRFGVDTDPRPDLNVTGGVSALRGKGFHPGTDATKTGLQWRDLNEDGVVQPIELLPVPATAATPSQNFTRWLVGADAQVRFQSKYGQTKVYGEVQLGSNMDRGLFPSDPVLTGVDTRQLGWYVGVLQDVTKYGIVGLRYDFYDPNSDALDKRAGKLIPFSQQIKTWSPLIGFVLPHARLYGQYDIIGNHLARNAVGVPEKLKSNTITVRLQVDL